MGQSSPDYGVVVAKDVMVPMRDGIKLAADIYWPAIDGERIGGPLPVILGRTSYDKTWPELWVEPVANFFAPRGYAVVLQDQRGRSASEGMGQYHHTANPLEGQDGYDTVEWIAAQPWSDGRVGMVGSSHGGIVQTAASIHRPPHLTAIWVDVAPTNIFAHQSREGGAMSLQMFGALFMHAYDSQEIRDDPDARREVLEGWDGIGRLVSEMPFRPGETPLRRVPNLEKVLFHYYYDGEYNDLWAMETCDQARHFARAADIPGVFSGGWYDPFAVATTGQYAAMAATKNTPQRLLMGPWTHQGMRNGATSFGDVEFGPEAGFGSPVYNEMRLRWFDRWLKDFDTGVEGDSPVRIFVMGGGSGRRNAEGRLEHGGTWRSEAEWPLARTVLKTLYLRSEGGLTEESPDESEAPSTYIHDPEHPVPSIAASVTGLSELVRVPEGVDPDRWQPRQRGRPLIIEGGAHQKEEPDRFGSTPPYPLLADRPDVLVFETAPLEEDTEVTGAVAVTLWVSSSALDTDFTAKLLDVYPPSADYPDGYHLNLADSIIRCRFRDGFNRAEPMEPGTAYEVRIDIPPTSNLFAAGHRIRVDVASSSFPKFDVNPNTGEPLGRHTHTIKARNTVFTDAARPSRIVLPMIL
jgi:putative CocE/NonD family hydrolase